MDNAILCNPIRSMFVNCWSHFKTPSEFQMGLFFMVLKLRACQIMASLRIGELFYGVAEHGPGHGRVSGL